MYCFQSSNSEDKAQQISTPALSSTTVSSDDAETSSEEVNGDDRSLSTSLLSSSSQLSDESSVISRASNYSQISSSSIPHQLMVNSDTSDDDISLPTSTDSFSLAASSILPSSDDDDDYNDVNRENLLDEPIYSEATLNNGHAFCQILRVNVENRLTKKALEDSLTTINLFLPEDLTMPKTKYQLLALIEKILTHPQLDFSIKHRICSQCYNYLGKWDEVQVENCLSCNSRKINSFFLQFNIEAELRDAFEIRDLSTLINTFRAECETKSPEKLYIITSGSEYRYLKSAVIPGQYDLFLIWYTDGAQVSKSGKSHIWPIYAQIVNICPKYRRSFQFVCGIFYSNRSNKKPDMNSFLQPFVSALENLYNNRF